MNLHEFRTRYPISPGEEVILFDTDWITFQYGITSCWPYEEDGSICIGVRKIEDETIDPINEVIHYADYDQVVRIPTLVRCPKCRQEMENPILRTVPDYTDTKGQTLMIDYSCCYRGYVLYSHRMATGFNESEMGQWFGDGRALEILKEGRHVGCEAAVWRSK